MFLFLGEIMEHHSLSLAWGIKVFGVIIGAIFALTLTGDIDEKQRLHLNLSVISKLSFSAFFGLTTGEFIVDNAITWELSVMGQSFISLMMSVFGMLVVGIVYQSLLITFHRKKLSEIVEEVKTTFKNIIK